MMRFLYFLRFAFVFTRALVMSNYQVAKLVLSPTLKIRPGFLSVPMEARTDFEITSLANSITLTPGTITVHIEPKEKLIIIHTIDIGADPEVIRADIRNTLEANILKWTRSSHGRKADAGGDA
ncbi:MAG: Na+/H+ antiporter subunit E [Phycisphaeraceae bacterium]